MPGMLTIAATTATAQEIGLGGIGIVEDTEVRRCCRSLADIALGQELIAASTTDGLPGAMAVLVRVAGYKTVTSRVLAPSPC
jgi:hypothetical protein